ncbi:MAG: VTT domain-containing protein [Flavobacteriales bacterium]|nr:VTT domain-containing protein [Flavobacteriales bacterium]
MSRKSLIRIIVLLVLTLALMYVGRHSGMNRYFGLEYLTQTIKHTGSFGLIMFTIVYIIGTLMNIPGMIFLFILFLVYDDVVGLSVGYISTLLSMIAHFQFTRSIAGNPFGEIQQPFIRKQLNNLMARPIQTTVVLRLVLFISPPVNYALALSPLKFKHFLIGSMLAMPFNLAANYLLTIYAKDWMMSCFG